MRALLVRAAGLAAIYLLVLTSLAPGDLLMGGLLGLAVAYALRPRVARRTADGSPLDRVRAAGGLLLHTAAETFRGSWRVARFCLGAPSNSGMVEIPRGDRSRVNVALWGVLTGEAPDEFVVDVDDERDVLIVHLVDASDPDAIRTRHRRTQERWYRRVAP